MMKGFISPRIKLLIWLGIFMLAAVFLATWQSFKSSPKHLDLSCSAKSFEMGENLESDVLLHIATVGKSVNFHYQFIDNGELVSSATLSGSFKTLDVANMDYQLQVDKVDIHVGDDEEWQRHDIADIVNYAQTTIEQDQSTLFDVRIVAMELERGYAVLQFSPGNSLWVCEI